MLLGINIGNTNTVLGLYSEDRICPHDIYRYSTYENLSKYKIKENIERFLSLHFEKKKISITGIAFSSVVPKVNDFYKDLSKVIFNKRALEISDKCSLSIIINYSDPAALGSDRIVNAEAAFNEYGGDLIIVDLGTAVTFCIMLDNRFDGGIIGPGVDISISALEKSTSKLPHIQFTRPDSLVAHDTLNALRSGFFYGWISMIEGIVSRIEKSYNKIFKLILTGGGSKIIADHFSKDVIFDEFLTMKGIKYIYDQNR